MATTLPWRPLYSSPPQVMPQSADAFGQFTRGLTSGFTAGRTRAQEHEVPELMAAAAALGDLRPEGIRPDELDDEAFAPWYRIAGNPYTRELAMRLLAGAR